MACLKTDDTDSRLGDLAERYLRVQDGTQRKLGATPAAQRPSRWAATVWYLSAAATVVFFARAVDPVLCRLERASLPRLTLELLEDTMIMLRTLGNRMWMPGLLLLGGVLLAGAAVDLWANWRSTEMLMTRIQLDKADALAGRIEQHLAIVRSQLGWVTQSSSDALTPEQRRVELLRLMRQAPAITEVAQFDAAGQELVRVSRLSVDRIGSGASFAEDARFKEAQARGVYVGPLYLNQRSEPQVSLALVHAKPRAGVSIAEVNLNALWQDIRATAVGRGGYAFVVDGRGRLIAHRDLEQVRRATDLSSLPQVAAALKGAPTRTPLEGNGVDSSLPGASVVSLHAAVPMTGWRVFVELPRSEARAPLWSALARLGCMLGVALVAALLASRLAARRRTPLPAAPAQA